MKIKGPGSPFVCLLDHQPAGLPLPEAFDSIYGPWPLPMSSERPFVYVNFVMSHDGRVSFNQPGHVGGGDISRRSNHDRWLMGLLRARADAVLLGATSLTAAGRHIWTPEAVFPEDAEAWQMVRAAEGRESTPLQVIATRSGQVDAVDAGVFQTPGLRVLLATTTEGIEKARSLLKRYPHIEPYITDKLDWHELFQELQQRYSVRTILCEAGPQVYGSLQAVGAVHDEFVTFSPILVGADAQAPRPSLIEGQAFDHADPPQSRLLAVHANGNYLFFHSRYRDPERG